MVIPKGHVTIPPKAVEPFLLQRTPCPTIEPKILKIKAPPPYREKVFVDPPKVVSKWKPPMSLPKRPPPKMPRPAPPTQPDANTPGGACSKDVSAPKKSPKVVRFQEPEVPPRVAFKAAPPRQLLLPPAEPRHEPSSSSNGYEPKTSQQSATTQAPGEEEPTAPTGGGAIYQAYSINF